MLQRKHGDHIINLMSVASVAFMHYLSHTTCFMRVLMVIVTAYALHALY